MILHRLLLLLLLSLPVMFGSEQMALMGLILPATVGLASVVCSLRNRRTWSLQLTSPVITEKHRQTAITILAESSAHLPGCLLCVLQLHNDLTGEQLERQLLLRAGRKQTLAMTADHCGRLTISVNRVRQLGLLGMLALPVAVSAQCRTTVQPDTFLPDIRLTVPETAAMDSDAYAPDRPGYDSSEVFRLREYVPGDSLRQIHWKLTGKTDHPVIREAGQPILQSLLIWWDKTTSPPAVPDAQAEVFASLCQALYHQGCLFTMGWNESDQEVLIPVDTEENLLRAIPMALRSGAAPRTDLPSFGKTVLLTTDPTLSTDERTTVLFCGDGRADALCYTPETYLTDLQMMEL